MNKKQAKHDSKIKLSKTISSPSKTDHKSKGFLNLLGLAIIVLLGIIIYSNSFTCSFHFDDIQNIVENPNIPGLTDFKAWWNFSHTRLVGFYSFALNIHFNQFNVWGYHLVNLIIHLINACVVWWLTLLLFSSPVMKDHPVSKYKNELAFINALLFVSHPLATQSVTYIVQRLTSMVAMFYLLSIAFYIKGRMLENPFIFKYLLFAGSILSAVLAICTKENAYTLPLAMILVEIYFLRTKKLIINFKDYRQILLIAGLIGFVILVSILFSVSVFKPIPPNETHNFYLTPWMYLLTQFSVIVKYIQLLFFPLNQILDYDFPISNSFFEIRTILSFLFLLSLIILAFFLYNRNRLISFGICWFFLTLSIESSIIPINDVIFEHRTYLPSFGFFLILSSGIYLWLREKNKMLAIALIAVVVGSYSMLTYQRNKVWKNDLTLWSDNVIKTPNKARPIHNRGYEFWKLGQWDKALSDYSKALELTPKYPLALSNRGVAYMHFKQWDKAIIDYTRSLEIDSNFAKSYSNRGIAYEQLKQWDKALVDYSKAIQINPNYSKAYSNRGVVYEKLLQWDKAIMDHSKAIELDAKNTIAYYNRGIAYEKLKQWHNAIADYSQTIKMDPKYKEAYIRRGFAYGELGLWDKTIADCNSAIGIDPNFAIAYTFLEIAKKNLGGLMNKK